jgi:hypothetical protein
MIRKDQQVAADELNTFTEIHSYEMETDRRRDLDNTNALLIALKQSPLRSQTTVPLEHQAPGAIQRLTNKLRQAVSIAGYSYINQILFCSRYLIICVASNVAESIAPGQSDMLLQLAQLDDIKERRSSTASTSSVDNEHLEYLVKMYRAYEEKNLPFSEQVRILSLIPQSWALTSKAIQEKFQCSSHAVKTARRLKQATDTPLHIEDKS